MRLLKVFMEATGLFTRLALASVHQRRRRAVLATISIAISLSSVLLAAGLGNGNASAHSGSAGRIISLLQPLLRRFAPAFLVACAAIIFVSTCEKVRSRGYEIGVLRLLGSSKTFVIATVATEAALMSTAGALLGLVISQSALTWLNVITRAAPPYSIDWNWCFIAPFGVIGAAISGSAIPCAVMLQQDVCDMLAWDR